VITVLVQIFLGLPMPAMTLACRAIPAILSDGQLYTFIRELGSAPQ